MATSSSCDCGSGRPNATLLLCAYQMNGEWDWQGAQHANDPVRYAGRTCVDDDPHSSLLTGGLHKAVARVGRWQAAGAAGPHQPVQRAAGRVAGLGENDHRTAR